MTHAATIEELVLSRPGYTLPSTVTLPERDGAAPGIVFFAGSGPTDRDWTSPLLPGRNGSAAQLALQLQARGVGSIRFDKVGSGVNMPTSAAELGMLDVLSLAHYVDEAVTAFEALAGRDACGPIFILGHSEGSIHASSAAVEKQADPRFGGLISLSGPSRSLLDTALEQIRGMRVQAGADPAETDAALDAFRAAMVQPDAPAPDLAALPEAAPLWQATHAPGQQAVARELLFADPLASLPAYRGRALVVSAANDAQVPVSDGDRIFAVLGTDPHHKSRVTIADANHVYKTERRTPGTIRPEEVIAGYADDDHPLAGGLVDAIVEFVTTR